MSPAPEVTGPGAVPGQRLVRVMVGELGRSGAGRAGGRSRRAPAKPAADAQGPGDGAAGAAPAQPEVSTWTVPWQADGPGQTVPGLGPEVAGGATQEAEPDLTLSLSPEDARAVRDGSLSPSVAFMQGRLKTAGDNALLLEVLEWTAGPGFRPALERLRG